MELLTEMIGMKIIVSASLRFFKTSGRFAVISIGDVMTVIIINDHCYDLLFNQN